MFANSDIVVFGALQVNQGFCEHQLEQSSAILLLCQEIHVHTVLLMKKSFLRNCCLILYFSFIIFFAQLKHL